jgi:hypothetical protein
LLPIFFAFRLDTLSFGLGACYAPLKIGAYFLIGCLSRRLFMALSEHQILTGSVRIAVEYLGGGFVIQLPLQVSPV